MIDERYPDPAEMASDLANPNNLKCPRCARATPRGGDYCFRCGWPVEGLSSVYGQAAAAGEGTPVSSSGRRYGAAERQAIIDGFRGPETYAASYVEQGTPDFIANAVAVGELVRQCQKDVEDAESAVRMALPAGVPGRTLDEAVAHAGQQASLRALTPARQREGALLRAAVTEWKLAAEALRRARQDQDRAEDAYQQILKDSRRAINHGR